MLSFGLASGGRGMPGATDLLKAHVFESAHHLKALFPKVFSLSVGIQV